MIDNDPPHLITFEHYLRKTGFPSITDVGQHNTDKKYKQFTLFDKTAHMTSSKLSYTRIYYQRKNNFKETSIIEHTAESGQLFLC